MQRNVKNPAMATFAFLAAASLATVVQHSAGCGGRTTGTEECDPGTRRPCTCEGGIPGEQTCDPTRQWRPCECCGDGITNGTEQCDGTDVPAGCEAGSFSCNADCTLDRSTCSAWCGDGITNGTEQCDGTDVPAGCEAGSFSCNADCTLDRSTCSAWCGDGVTNGNEECDGTSVPPGCEEGFFSCEPDCTLDRSTCTAWCGDGIMNGTETCDGTDFGNVTCETMGYAGGQLQCDANCRFEPCTTCTPSCEIPNDGVDQDCNGSDLEGAPGEWVKSPCNPVLSWGPFGSWDAFTVQTPEVIRRNGLFHLYYLARAVDGGVYRIGYATSVNGVDWDKEPTNPVIDVGQPGAFDDEGVGPASVFFDGSEYRMYHGGWDGAESRTGLATSPDLVTWTKQGVVLDSGPPGSHDDDRTSAQTVLKESAGVYKMWYSAHGGGQAYHVAYATSNDGLTWFKQGTQLTVGTSGQWDDGAVFLPVVVPTPAGYHMWYVGGYPYQTGHAFSTDGLTWQKNAANPVLPVSAGQWDAGAVMLTTVIVYNTIYMGWYYGSDGTGSGQYEIGLATRKP